FPRARSQTLVELPDGAVVIPALRQKRPAIGERLPVSRIDLQRRRVVLHRQKRFPHRFADDAAIVQDVGAAGIEPQRPGIVAQGALEVAAFVLRDAAPVERIRPAHVVFIASIMIPSSSRSVNSTGLYFMLPPREAWTMGATSSFVKP